MDFEPELPIPISLVEDKLLLFDINVITWLRRTHHICGVMTGTLPQNPSQNVFLGLPVQIMPEEAQLLVEKDVAYLTDDRQAHEQATRSSNSARQADYLAHVRRKAEQASKIRTGQKEELKRHALKKQSKKQVKSTVEQSARCISSTSVIGKSPLESESRSNTFNAARLPLFSSSDNVITAEAVPSFFESEPTEVDSLSNSSSTVVSTMSIPIITPTTSQHLLASPIHSSIHRSHLQVPNLPSSYPLYRYLNSKNYYTTPGLRFGCQYSVYPGDPLRFHSHFLAVGYEWTQDVDLMDIVGGGRLGTGVKKGWLIGAEEPVSLSSHFSIPSSTSSIIDSVTAGGPQHFVSNSVNGNKNASKNQNPDQSQNNRVRTFSIEWAAM